MDRFLTQLILKERERYKKMIFIAGPRQVGKTTLLKQLAEHYPGPLFNWDDLDDRRLLTKTPNEAFQGSAVYFDEIHKYPRWKNFLKGKFDTQGSQCLIHVTGSARLDVYRRGGDSMMGRYHLFRMHPLTVAEVLGQPLRLESPDHGSFRQNGTPTSAQGDTWRTLARFGGFPEPFLAGTERRHRQWQNMRHERLVREDIRDMSHVRELALLEKMIQLLPERVGGLLSLNALRLDIMVSHDAVRSWVSLLEDFYYHFLLSPYTGRLARALNKERKLFLWDWSEVTEPGPRFENMVASHLLKWCHYLTDTGLANAELHYLRDKEKREVDFLITFDRKPWCLVEAKRSDRTVSKDALYFSERLGRVPIYHVVDDHGGTEHRKPEGIPYTTLSAAAFCGALV